MNPRNPSRGQAVERAKLTDSQRITRLQGKLRMARSKERKLEQEAREHERQAEWKRNALGRQRMRITNLLAEIARAANERSEKWKDYQERVKATSVATEATP